MTIVPGIDTDLTANTIAEMFRTHMQRGPHPDQRSCERLAAIINSWRPGGWKRLRFEQERFPRVALTGNPLLWPDPSRAFEIWNVSDKERDSWDASADTLFAAVRKRRRETQEMPVSVGMLQAMQDLEEALLNAAKFFGWGPARPYEKDWHAPALDIMSYVDAFIRHFRPSAGPGRNSSAARFTEDALTRIALPAAEDKSTPKAAAISDLFKRMRELSGSDD